MLEILRDFDFFVPDFVAALVRPVLLLIFPLEFEIVPADVVAILLLFRLVVALVVARVVDGLIVVSLIKN